MRAACLPCVSGRHSNVSTIGAHMAPDRKALPGKAFIELSSHRLNGLDNPFRHPDHFDALHIKSGENTGALLRCAMRFTAHKKNASFANTGIYPYFPPACGTAESRAGGRAYVTQCFVVRNNRAETGTSGKHCDTRRCRRIPRSIPLRAGTRIFHKRGSPPRSTYPRSGTACAGSAP